MRIKEYIIMLAIVSPIIFIIYFIFSGLQEAVFYTTLIDVITTVLYIGLRYYRKKRGEKRNSEGK